MTLVVRDVFLRRIQHLVLLLANAHQRDITESRSTEAVSDELSGLVGLVETQPGGACPAPADSSDSSDLPAAQVCPDQTVRALGERTADQDSWLSAGNIKHTARRSVIRKPLTPGIRRAPGRIDRIVRRKLIDEVDLVTDEPADAVGARRDEAAGRIIVAVRADVCSAVIIHTVPVDRVLSGLEERFADQVADAAAIAVLDDEGEVAVLWEGERDGYGWFRVADEWGKGEAGEDEEAHTEARRHEGIWEGTFHWWVSVLYCFLSLLSACDECWDDGGSSTENDGARGLAALVSSIVLTSLLPQS